jgi:hypothetical protein
MEARFPEFGNQVVELLYFTNVSNASELLELIRGGKLSVSLINPEYVHPYQSYLMHRLLIGFLYFCQLG